MHNNIRKKLLIYIVPFIFLILVSGAGYRILNAEKILKQQVYQGILYEQDKRSSEIEKTVAKIKGNADTFAGGVHSTYTYLDINTYEDIIKGTLSNNPVIQSYGVWFEPYSIDPTQKDVRAFDDNAKGYISSSEYYNTKSFDYLNNELYKRSKETNKSFFEDSYYDEISKMHLIMYVTPLHNSDGEFMGCVSVSFSVNELTKYITESSSQLIDFYIVNNSGDYIAAKNLNLLKSQPNILDSDNKLKENAQTILDTESGTFSYQRDNEKYYVYYSTVSDFKWKFIYEVPQSLIYDQLNDIVALNIVLITLSIISIIGLIYFFSSKFVHAPFKLLLTEFKNISNNNFDSDITEQLLKTDTEFNDVGKALVDMKGSLSEYQSTLLSKNKLLVENEKVLKETINYVNTIISALPVMMFVFDRSGHCIECHGSDSFKSKPNSFFAGKHCTDFLGDANKSDNDFTKFLDILKNINYSDGIIRIELPIFVDGNQEFFEHTLTLCRDNEIISLCRRTTDNVNYMEHMKYISSYDELTGVFNSRYFSDLLKNYNLKKNPLVTVVVLDVNGFKSINDNYGYRLGDKLLTELSNALTSITLPNKIVARIAGDEFAVVLPNVTKEEAENIFEKFNADCLEKRVFELSFSISFGIDTAVTETDNLLQISKFAEELLYKQKIYTSSGQKDNTIELINSTLLAKNKREQLHSNRVSELCVEMAIALGWSKLEQNKIRTAGLLHDIGKIGISDAILNKPGLLNEVEYSELRTHPEIGYRILQSSKNLKELSEYVYSHHEKWDGTGYPRRLKGTEIVIEARIIAIVDAYDAITSSRSYRDGLPKEIAINELITCKNTQFDPELVDIFIEKVLHEKLEDYQ